MAKSKYSHSKREGWGHRKEEWNLNKSKPSRANVKSCSSLRASGECSAMM